MSPGYSGAKNPVNWKVWIDYNNNQQFGDTGEEIFSALNNRNNASGKITIPRGVAPLVTRMRVAMSFGEIRLWWGTFQRGEVEDYTMEIALRASSKNNDMGIGFEIPSMTVYPNPVNDKLFIKLSNWDSIRKIKLTDMTGRMVHLTETSDNLIMLDVSGYNKGFYILTVTDGRNIDSQKVTVH